MHREAVLSKASGSSCGEGGGRIVFGGAAAARSDGEEEGWWPVPFAQTPMFESWAREMELTPEEMEAFQAADNVSPEEFSAAAQGDGPVRESSVGQAGNPAAGCLSSEGSAATASAGNGRRSPAVGLSAQLPAGSSSASLGPSFNRGMGRSRQSFDRHMALLSDTLGLVQGQAADDPADQNNDQRNAASVLASVDSACTKQQVFGMTLSSQFGGSASLGESYGLMAGRKPERQSLSPVLARPNEALRSRGWQIERTLLEGMVRNVQNFYTRPAADQTERPNDDDGRTLPQLMDDDYQVFSGSSAISGLSYHSRFPRRTALFREEQPHPSWDLAEEELPWRPRKGSSAASDPSDSFASSDRRSGVRTDRERHPAFPGMKGWKAARSKRSRQTSSSETAQEKEEEVQLPDPDGKDGEQAGEEEEDGSAAALAGSRSVSSERSTRSGKAASGKATVTFSTI